MAQARRVKTRWLVLAAVLFSLLCWLLWTPLGLRGGLLRAARGQRGEWAASAVVLGAAAPSPPNPSPDDLGWRDAVTLDRFWLRAGRGEPTIGTRARITWDEQALYVGAECAEPDAAYRPRRAATIRDPLIRAPDRLEVQFCGDWQGAVWLLQLGADGSSELVWRPARWWYVTDREQRVAGVSTRTEAVTGGWRALITIPWSLLGGRPHGSFGLNIIRCHDRSGEQSSPIVLDWPDWPTCSGLLEMSFGAHPRVVSSAGTLTRLPSGTAVWQRTTRLRRADAAERQALVDQARGLSARTTAASLAARVNLAQRWYEQLVLDGYSLFGTDVQWKPRPGEWQPQEAREHVSRSLRRGDVAAACRIVDTYLGQLQRATRQWYASGTLLDAATESDAARGTWAQVEQVSAPRIEGDTAHLRLTAGRAGLDLRAALSLVDSVPTWRLWTPRSGGYDSGRRLPLTVRTDESGRLVLGAEAAPRGPRLRYRAAPWRLELLADDGEVRWSLDASRLALLLSADGQPRAVDLRGPLWANESMVGGGERFDALDQRGRSFSLWDEDAWDGTMRGVANQSYKPIPLWHSSRGWSMFWATSYRLRCDLGASVTDQYRLTAHGPVLDWWLWTAPPADAIRAYTALTGRAKVPPRWAFSPWMGGNRHRWLLDPRPRTEGLLAEARRYRELDIPLGTAYVEAELSVERKLYDGLRAMGVRPVAWTDTIAIRGAEYGGFRGQQPDERLPRCRTVAGALTDWVDYTSPATPDYVRRVWRERLSWGLSGCMVDYGDILPEDALLADGRRGDEAHNVYSVDYAAAHDRCFRAARGDDFVLIARPMGPGSQRYVVPFAGDQPASFRGLAMMVTAAASDSASGFGLFTCDIGMFHGLPDREVYLRSAALGALTTLMRNHGISPREPWFYDDEATAIYRRWAWLRMGLLDYLVGNAQDAATSGLPALRAPLLDWPLVPDAWQCNDELLVGTDLLMAPVLSASRSREVWLPPGRWVDWWTGEGYDGPRRLNAPAPLDQMPMYLRAGAMVPLRVPQSLRLGDSLSAGSQPALLITPPDHDRELALPRDGARTGIAQLERVEDGFVLRLPADEPARLVVVMGARLRSARLGGEELPRVEEPSRTLLTIPAGGLRTITCRVLTGSAGKAASSRNTLPRGAR